MELEWKTSELASCCHTIVGIVRGLPLADSRLGEPFADAALTLRQHVASLRLPEGPFWSNLLAYSHQVDDQRSLLRTVIRKSIGIDSTSEDLVVKLANDLREVELSWRQALPLMLDDLTLRMRPLQEQWEARGPGLLRAIGQLTDERLLAERATVVAVHPAFGGGGSASLATNVVRIEALLTNVVDGLPEVVRLGWLLAQLNHELPLFCDRIHGSRLSLIAQLAMLPGVLQASETVELSELTPFTIAEALPAWKIEVAADKDIAGTLLTWWDTYRQTRPAWGIALAALDQMIGD
ncbi:MAG: hypothetical protein H6822_08370 [Planctomycetaceae bacterium]|nr:hypothetical protein [Planctomycetales bacterium]MCB9922183.1 hypothetical protein [Planctomycetaceae bacterium]